MENLTNKQKYLVVKNSIELEIIKEYDFLKSFMDAVAMKIIKEQPLTDKQNELLNIYFQEVKKYFSGEDQLLIDELNKEAYNTDILFILSIQKYKTEEKEISEDVKRNKRAYEAMLKIKEKKKLAQENGN